MIGLIDCNNFYVSCERAFQPHLNGHPVGIMSNNDGCVIARSEELKAMGIDMGTPAFKLQELTRRKAITLLSSNYELYGDMSRRVQATLETLSPAVEPYSIDEMFVHVHGFANAALREHAREIHRRTHQYTGIPVSVGIAPTRTLAKLANRAAKKIPGYGGVCVLPPGSAETKGLLQRTPLRGVWGIGRRLAERLAIVGIHTAWDLHNQDHKHIKRKFSITLEHTVLELQGRSAIGLHDVLEARQRIMTSRSFGQLTSDKREIQEAIRQHAQRSAARLRQQNSLARAVLVFLKTNPHRQEPQYAPSQALELDRPTCDSREIVHAAQRVLDTLYRPRYRYMKVGVMLLDLVDAHRQQLSLLDSQQSEAERQRSARLMTTMDLLNQRMGHDTVRLGMPSKQAAWHLRCAHRTPRWTTRWDELPKAGTD